MELPGYPDYHGLITDSRNFHGFRGRSGGAMVLGKLPVPGRPTIWMIVGQGPIALAIGAGGGCLDIFTLLCPFSPSLWETARCRLKHCLKGPLNPKQPTNQHSRIQEFREFENVRSIVDKPRINTCTLLK